MSLYNARYDTRKSTLLSIIYYKYRIIYGKGYEFSDEQRLHEIQPDDIYKKWMLALMVFGQPDPSHDENPTFGRSTSLEYYKKDIPTYAKPASNMECAQQNRQPKNQIPNHHLPPVHYIAGRRRKFANLGNLQQHAILRL